MGSRSERRLAYRQRITSLQNRLRADLRAEIQGETNRVRTEIIDNWFSRTQAQWFEWVTAGEKQDRTIALEQLKEEFCK